MYGNKTENEELVAPFGGVKLSQSSVMMSQVRNNTPVALIALIRED